MIQALVVKPYQIPSPSMVPTLTEGQRILVNRFIYRFSDPDVGDVVVFNPPGGADTDVCGNPQAGPSRTNAPCDTPSPEKSNQTFVKRIVAGPGDTLSIRDGHPVVNGEVAQEDFIRPCDAQQGGSGCNLPTTITIPEDHYFMMGDNRGHSQDSRFWGPVPRDWIIGPAFATYWPPDRVGIFSF